jgi:probable rRNA maturation factor
MSAARKTAKPRPRSSLSVQRAASGAPSTRALLRFARAAAPGSRVTLRVVGAAEGRRLNLAFRGRDYATNVLSFSYGRNAGDIVLCQPVIAREAREQGKALAAHYAHLVVHGLLHLRGRRHGKSMERSEIRILKRLGYSDPYTLK